MTRLKLEHISYGYGERKILEDICLQVAEGEIVALLGPSGVGKSTLFNLIAGILQPQEGRLFLDGQENPKGQVSYMLQKDLLLEHKTVLGNISLPLILKKIPKQEAEQQSLDLLSTFGLLETKNLYPRELSGGMRQRIALLRTYMLGHSLFLLDEAFSALDEMTKIELYAWYQTIHEQLGLTTFLITHSIEEALTLSNRIYILKNRPGHLVGEIELAWDPHQDKDLQKIAYKKQILEILA